MAGPPHEARQQVTDMVVLPQGVGRAVHESYYDPCPCPVDQAMVPGVGSVCAHARVRVQKLPSGPMRPPPRRHLVDFGVYRNSNAQVG